MGASKLIASYVRPNREGGWDVIRDGHRRPTAHAASQAEAVDAARRITRNHGGGEILVMNEYGKLVETDVVRRPLLRPLRVAR
jgi:hypothetical protein